MRFRIPKKIATNAGFTLVEIAVVLMMSGFFMLMGAEFVKLYTTNSQREKTLEHLRISQRALHEYFGLEGRYPCPADPTLPPNDANYGREMCRSSLNLTANPDDCTGTPLNLSCTTNFSRDGDQNGQPDVVMIGVIPFRTLFERVVDTPFTENQRLDGNSIYLSYAVTEHMSDSTRFNVFNRANPNTGGIRIEDENQLSVVDPDDSAHYALFSHGDNRKGGFTTAGNMVDDCLIPSMGGPPVVPAPGPSGGGIDVEIENCDNNDAIFVKGIRSLADTANYNDDFLFFKARGHVALWKASLASPAGESYIYNTNLGNVGVGTIDPDQALHVVGDLSAETSTIGVQYCEGNGADCLIPSMIAGTGSTCANPDQVAYAIQNNQLVCRDINWVMPPQNCPAGQYLKAFSNLGTIECDTPPP